MSFDSLIQTITGVTHLREQLNDMLAFQVTLRTWRESYRELLKLVRGTFLPQEETSTCNYKIDLEKVSIYLHSTVHLHVGLFPVFLRNVPPRDCLHLQKR